MLEVNALLHKAKELLLGAQVKRVEPRLSCGFQNLPQADPIFQNFIKDLAYSNRSDLPPRNRPDIMIRDKSAHSESGSSRKADWNSVVVDLAAGNRLTRGIQLCHFPQDPGTTVEVASSGKSEQ